MLALLMPSFLVIANAERDPTPQLRFATSFGDGMVLQRDGRNHRSSTVWGFCDGCVGDVEVSFGHGPATKGKVDRGRWSVQLPPLNATKPGETFDLRATNACCRDATVSDVVVGDVWLCKFKCHLLFEPLTAFDSPRRRD